MSAADATTGHPPAPSPAAPFLAGARLVDLSMPITEHWRFAPEITYRSDVAAGQPFQSTFLTCRAHSFTHVDAPWHVEPDGTKLGDVDPAALWGEASVVDVSDLGDDARIGATELAERGAAVRDGDIVLLRTDHEVRHPTTEHGYWTASPWVDASAARWLLGRRARAVGFDFPQDRGTRAPYDSDYSDAGLPLEDSWATHRLLLAAGIPLVEYLTNLAAIGASRTTVSLLPLNLPHSDGAPTRAIAFC